MKTSLNVAIIGLGNIGLKYDLHLDMKYVYSHARAFFLHPAFTLVAGIDPNPQTRQLFEQHYSCPGFENLSMPLKELQPEVVVIASPTQLHLNHLEEVLSCGTPKYILIEKPFGYQWERAKELLKRCEEKNIEVYVNYIRATEPGASQLKSWLNNKSIDKGILWYCKGLFNGASHFLNLLQSWFGEVQHVDQLNFCRWWNSNDPELDFRIHFTHQDKKIQIFVISAKAEQFFHNQIELIGSSGRILYKEGGKSIHYQTLKQDPLLPAYTTLSGPRHFETDFNRIQWHVVNHLSRRDSGQSTLLCSGNQALKTLKLLTQLKEMIQ